MRQPHRFVSNARSGQNHVLKFVDLIAMGFIILAFSVAALAQETVGQQRDNSRDEEETLRVDENVSPAEDPLKPRRHFRVSNPDHLSNHDAEQLYTDLKVQMAQAYRLASLADIADYQSWTRYNIAPYRSAAHGNRYVNNYANDAARAYGKFEQAGRMPVGAIIAKDNVTLTADGAVSPGALVVMEKMPEGFNFISGDWRYTMVMPDGSIFGTTNGEGSERVKFCITCHLAAERHDHLFFMPNEYRR